MGKKKKKKKDKKHKKHKVYKPLIWQGWYLCRDEKRRIIFGLRVAGNRIDFSNYVRFPTGMLWRDARTTMDKKGIRYEYRSELEPPF